MAIINTIGFNIPVAPINTNGLVVHYDAYNVSSYPRTGTKIFDITQRATKNTGTLTNGTTFATDLAFASMKFDGTNDTITTTAGTDFAYGTGDFTFDGWVYPTAFTSTFGARVFWSQTTGGDNYFYMGLVNSGTLFMTINFTDYFSTATLTLNKWNYVAYTRIGTDLRLYINTTRSAGATNTTNLSNTTYVPTIGNYTHSSQLPFQGNMAIWRVYKGVGLNQTQVEQNYNAQRGRFGL